MFGIDGKVLSRSPERVIFTVVLQNCEKSVVKHSKEKRMLLNFAYLPTIFSFKVVTFRKEFLGK